MTKQLVETSRAWLEARRRRLMEPLPEGSYEEIERINKTIAHQMTMDLSFPEYVETRGNDYEQIASIGTN